METTITGTLEYLGWQRPWLVQTDAGPIDLSVHFWRVAQHLESQPTTLDYERDAVSVRRDESSEMVLKHGGVGEGVIVTKAVGFGFSSVMAYLEWGLHSLNGRVIVAKIIDDDAFTIEAAPGEDVPGVQFYGSGNMARVPSGMESAVCNVGQADCCVFLTASERGFECAKFSGSLATMLLDRKANDTIRARRIGNCRCVGREPKS